MTRILLRGGHVHTPADRPVTALCIDGGTVVWTGDDDASVHFEDNADRVVELRGRLVTPAFVDAHVHLAQSGFAAASLDLAGASSVHEALDTLASYARGSAVPVIQGFGWDETGWPEQRAFTREEVDRASNGRLVILSRVDVHSAVLSSAFLDACPDVAGADGYDATGRVERDAHHAARQGLFRLLPQSARQEAILGALQDAARNGIAMVHELGAPHICPPEDFDVIGALGEASAMGEGSALPETVWYWGSLAVNDARRFGCAGAAGDLCVDGSIGSRTSALHAAYADQDTRGHLYVDAAQVAQHVLACTREDLQAGFHAIGDRAVTEVVKGFRDAADMVGAAAIVRARHRLEHLEMTSVEDMTTLGELGVTASMQPRFDDYWGGADGLYSERLGVERARTMNAFASLSRAGVNLAFGSDSPVTPFEPWAAVRAAAWHHTESERITARAAFDAHTRGGWLAARRDEGGVIGVGAPASLAVWAVPGDLVAGVPHLPDLDPAQDLPTCEMTLVNGRVAFEETGVLE